MNVQICNHPYLFTIDDYEIGEDMIRSRYMCIYIYMYVCMCRLGYVVLSSFFMNAQRDRERFCFFS